VIVADLSPYELHQRLKTGLSLRTGPVVCRISSTLRLVEHGLSLLYKHHVIEESDFADFYVRVAKPSGLRRWLHPQAFFYFDDTNPFNPLPADQAFPLLEWGLNWCFAGYCHRYLTLHAAVVERNGLAMILPAPPGSGKSTLCAALIHRGWRLLSDELAIIEPEKVSLVPNPRPVSLKNASIDVIGAFAPDAVFSPAVQETVKGRVAHMCPPEDSVKRSDEVSRPGWVVFPRYVAGQCAQLEPLPKAKALFQLAENSFNYSTHGVAGFETLSKVVDSSTCFSFSYGNLDEAMSVFADLANTALVNR
jgi:HprK-related kinase A